MHTHMWALGREKGEVPLRIALSGSQGHVMTREGTDMARSKLGSKRRMPNGRWQIRVSRGYRVDGRQRVMTETVDTEEEADRRISELASEMGRRPEMGMGLTLKGLWDLYRADKMPRLAKRTQQTYEWNVERYWLPRLGSADVTAISHADVQDVLTPLTRQNATHAKVALSSLLTYGVSLGALRSNVVRESYEMPGDTGSERDEDAMWEDDPFGEHAAKVWDAATVMRAFPLMRGLPLEPVWMVMVGGGLDIQEALALRGKDVRRVAVGDRMVTQVSVHHARNSAERRKSTKGPRRRRIVAVMDPFGERLWELADGKGEDLVCEVSADRQNARWRGYFTPLSKSRHVPKNTDGIYRGRLATLPYTPLRNMRHTNETLMQQAGILDSLNAAIHGHSQAVSYAHYQHGDLTKAAVVASDRLRFVV